MLVRPSQRASPGGRPVLAATLTAAADAAWVADWSRRLLNHARRRYGAPRRSHRLRSRGGSLLAPTRRWLSPRVHGRRVHDMPGGSPPGLPPDRGPEFELRIETGSHRTSSMPRSLPMKRWSQGELTWESCSRASQTGSGVSAKTIAPAITQRSVEPLSHVEQMVDETRGARFFSKLDRSRCSSASAKRTRFKTSFRMPYGQAVPHPRGGPGSRRPSACLTASPSFGSVPSACTACRWSSCGSCTRSSAALTLACPCSVASCRCTVMISLSSPRRGRSTWRKIGKNIYDDVQMCKQMCRTYAENMQKLCKKVFKKHTRTRKYAEKCARKICFVCNRF